MQKMCLPPYPPALIESIRSIGYTVESAVADLIDNSITAEASVVNIRFSPYGQPFVAILDNGKGMYPEELTLAMRHGSKNPIEFREENDLGRFGLGLKTASLSQCRRLTVVSLKGGIFSGRCWDLDIIIDDEAWTLLQLDLNEIFDLPLIDELERQGNGTLVIWQNLDRISSGESSLERALGAKMDRVWEHLALVFHRYLSGEDDLPKLEIYINERPVDPVDPYLQIRKATQKEREEVVMIEGQKVTIKPFILPHMSKLTSDELKAAGGEEGLRRHQGFYVYRNKRLIVWGTWFRLVKQEELTKLARVRVDIPNTLDHLWTIDIKKSTASPPEEVRQKLKQIVERIANRSREVYRFRGRKKNNNNFIQLWDRVQGREGISYKVNRKHPLVQAMEIKLNKDSQKIFHMLLKTLESSFPIDSLYADMAEEFRVNVNEENIKEKLLELAEQLFSVANEIEGGKKRILENLHMLEPFCLYPEIVQEIVKEECSYVE